MISQLDGMEPIDLLLSPDEVVEKLRHLEGLVFFDTSGNLPSRYHDACSIIAANPVKMFRGNLEDTREIESYLTEATSVDRAGVDGGGLCGWVNYDGSFTFGAYHEVLVYHHSESQWYETGSLSEQFETDGEGAADQAEEAELLIGEFTSNMDRQMYMRKVERIHEYIKSGDIYQVNLTQRYEAEVEGRDLFPLYKELRKMSPAPMASYMELDGRVVLSSSPETFLRMSGQKIETRPIKGTMPRYDDPKKDQESAEKLLASEKEKAELVMITDLERNDLGRVCEYGSVEVKELIELEELEHVYHLVSRVSGTLRTEVNHLDALKECFPGGSITGAPKIRAMEIIDELETVSRGIYTGAVGYLGFNNESQFNIVIRTLVREGGKLHYHVGAGIVIDSDPEAEYQETLHKAKGVRAALKGFM